MRNMRLLASSALFGGGLLIAWISHGTGVIHDDPERNIAIPTTLTVPLQVQAAYNDATMFIRYRWPADPPGILHDVLRFEDGTWSVEGKAVPGSQPDGLHEDRVAMLLDDGSVPAFGRYGGYIAIGAGLAGLTTEAPEEVTKYLSDTRSAPDRWDDPVDDVTQTQLRAAGYFLDLWHWRGGRSNPVGVADDQNVSSGRDGDSGGSSYSTNWDADLQQPKVMFDAAIAGHKALNWEDVAAHRVSQDDTYALTPEVTIAFDPDAGWQNGDVLPRRILTPGTGSRGDITVEGEGRWTEGFWDVTMRRALDTGHPEDDKILVDHRTYDVAFAIHRNATGGRWHYVSLPLTLGLGHEAEIVATKFTGPTPQWPDAWSEVALFYPGQVTWPMLNSAAHAGAGAIAGGVPVRARHSPEQLVHYGIETEFKSEIRRQWLLTLTAGVLMIAAFGFAVSSAITPSKGA